MLETEKWCVLRKGKGKACIWQIHPITSSVRMMVSVKKKLISDYSDNMPFGWHEGIT